VNVDAETPGRDACEPDAWTVVLVNREVSLDEALERSLQVPRANRHRKRRIHRRAGSAAHDQQHARHQQRGTDQARGCQFAARKSHDAEAVDRE